MSNGTGQQVFTGGTNTDFSVDKTNVKSQFVTDTSNDLVDQKNDNKDVVSNDSQDTVSRKSFEKLLNQRKSDQSELRELRVYKQEREEQEQLKRGEYEKILQSKDERIKSLQADIDAKNLERIEGKKLHAFLEKLPGKISDEDFMIHINTDAINIDPETGEIDSLSLEKEVDRFNKKYHRVIDYGNKKSLPSMGFLGGRPGVKKSLKEMSREELRENFIKGNFRK